MKDVIISIVGTQRSAADGQKDTVQLVTAGKYGFEDGLVRFSYDESELTGMNGTHTTFTVKPMCVLLRREGETNSQMIFEQGRKNYVLYETPVGTATMGIDTRTIVNALSEHGGHLELDYGVDLNNAPLGQNHFNIDVRESSHV